MSKLDINKINLILDLTKKHLKDNDEYRFACNLNTIEKVFIEKYYNVKEVDDYGDKKLYKLTSKK